MCHETCAAPFSIKIKQTHALQFWPANPAPEALLLGGWMLSLFGSILAVIGIWDKRERHPLDFLGLFMNVISFAVPAWLLH